MGRIEIERKRCKGCRICIESCPKGLIVLDKSLNIRGVQPARFKGNVRRSSSKGGCTGCTFCALVCPECCIEVYK